MKVWESPYTVKTTEKKHRMKNVWSSLSVEIFKDGKKIGQYERNYPELFNTFHPFQKNGKDYALYSKDYTSTRVMSLPDCKDLGGESRNTFGFCPTGYAIPIGEWKDDYRFKGEFGFICGCVWGDDTSWKIQFLDLSEVEKGIIKRDSRFGYIELLGKAETLKDAIDLINYDPEPDEDGCIEDNIIISCAKYFRLNEKENV